ncbi:MAG TPA: DUF4058 family protein [Isosphaeraceae bacterium]|nr:DUF4058 family protein [Isosphaeraceae bacterium]
MPSPFPGMDPYLENPDHWPGIHHNLISGIQGQLSAQLRPLSGKLATWADQLLRSKGLR